MSSDTLLSASALTLVNNDGRQIVSNLNMQIGYDQVAIVGRNGAGKSSLIRALCAPDTPKNITRTTHFCCVYQSLDDNLFKVNIDSIESFFVDFDPERILDEFTKIGLVAKPKQTHFSSGELRKINLVYAKLSSPQLLVLDEPASDLDEQGVEWLIEWLTSWQQGLLVVTHDPRVQNIFNHFFLLEEAGCRSFSGSYGALKSMLEQEQHNQQIKYVGRLNTLLKQEKKAERVAKRRQQKKNQGRLRELGRMTSRQRLNSKRSWAQESQSRVANIAIDKRVVLADLVKSARRELNVSLPLELYMPSVPAPTDMMRVELESVSIDGVFSNVTLSLSRKRIAIVGDNGTGKTSLIRLMLGLLDPSGGRVKRVLQNVGYISQNGHNWRTQKSVFETLWEILPLQSNRDILSMMVAHKFPLGLAQKSMVDLSCGERLRAALICLFAAATHQQRPMDYLVLDEPTVGLDDIARNGLKKALCLWQGGLIIASHDKIFLDELALDGNIQITNQEVTVRDLRQCGV